MTPNYDVVDDDKIPVWARLVAGLSLAVLASSVLFVIYNAALLG
jgi:hypothetical protein